MEDGDYLSLIFIAILILISGYFSGSETAFFSLNKFKLNKLRKKKKNNFLIYLLERPRKLLITIILINLFVNILATVLATEFFINKFGILKGNIASSVIMTLLLLFFGEITPKLIAVNTAETFSVISAPFMSFFVFILNPISRIFLKIVNLFLKILKMNEYTTESSISSEELKTIIDMGNEEGIIKQDEKDMLRSVFEFSDTDVKEIMTPRIDMTCIDVNTSIIEIARLIREEQFSRIPVYEGNVDNILGILYVKDILPYLAGLKELTNIKQYLRSAFYVPESKTASSLLKFMQINKTHIVMVADEYGGTEGLVTMEDLIEELVGEIHDEYDEIDKEYEFFDNNTIIVNAKMHIDDINELLDLKIPENIGFNSIGGFIMNRLGRIPEENDIIKNEEFDVFVLKMEGNRIEKVKILKKEIRL
ncbi:MAG: hemolysin family protein [Candidatus Muirbacterium halophilum]|nr:hemolysin family protein [Candidatus Muirbacterium halophilum]MCK9474909.1 hemolysin family protein [Candidatus Muirbacterium halophilum]